MKLVRLIYVSSLSHATNPVSLMDIHTTAHTNNSQKHISGMLCFGNLFFLQCLEGGSKAINELYPKLLKDTRHENVMLIDYESIFEREFDEWGMKLVKLDSKFEKSLFKFTSDGQFNPYSMDKENALRLMMFLRDLA